MESYKIKRCPKEWDLSQKKGTLSPLVYEVIIIMIMAKCFTCMLFI